MKTIEKTTETVLRILATPRAEVAAVTPPPVESTPQEVNHCVRTQREAVLRQAWEEAEEATRQVSGGVFVPSQKAPLSPMDPCFKSRCYSDTDSGSAERFVDWVGEFVAYIYDHPEGGSNGGIWVVWHPTRGWLPDKIGVIRRLAKAMSDRMVHPEAQGIERTWAAKSGANGSITAMLSMARSKRSLPFASLDRDPFALALQDCVIDLKTGSRRPFSRDEMITQRCSITYNPSAQPQALLSCFQGNYNPEDLSTLQEFLGSCLNGAQRDRLLLYWQGPSGSGKTTATKAMQNLMGSYATQVDVDMYSTSRQSRDVETELARIGGKRFVFAPECDNHRTLCESRIKWLTGGDALRFRALYQTAGISENTAKHLIYGNLKPRVEGRDKAFWRRILLIQATGGVEQGKEDPELQERATKDLLELQGLLNWLLEGHRRWVQNGMRLLLSERALESRKRYEAEEDTVGAFLEEKTDANKEEKELCSDVYQSYKSWAENEGLRYSLSSKAFAATLEDDYEKVKIRGSRYWKGIKLKIKE